MPRRWRSSPGSTAGTFCRFPTSAISASLQAAPARGAGSPSHALSVQSRGLPACVRDLERDAHGGWERVGDLHVVGSIPTRRTFKRTKPAPRKGSFLLGRTAAQCSELGPFTDGEPTSLAGGFSPPPFPGT